MTYSDNAIAVILLCSQLGITSSSLKPFTNVQWNELVSKLTQSSVKEPANLMSMTATEIQHSLNILPVQAERIFELLSRGGNIAFLLNQLAQKAIHIVTRSEAKYPLRLRKKLGKNAPPLLYYCGSLELANREGLAIVGSRNIDPAGEKFARTLAKRTAESSYVVYSGGAKGVDTISEQSALENGGCCISFLSDSMERKIRIPAICNAISNNKMLLLSTVSPSAGFHTGNAMARNQYIYALSLCTVVVASEHNKGGTWTGATHSIKTSLVNTYVWNNPKYIGNQALIKAGGLPIEDNFEKLSIVDLITAEEPKPLNKLEQESLLDSLNEQFTDSIPKIEKELPKVEQLLSADVETKTDLCNLSELNQDKRQSSDIENKITLVGQQEIPNQNIIYKAILPILLNCTQNPTTIDEIAKQLNILKKQAEIWVKYAVESKQIKRLSSPVRYVRSD